MTLAPAAATLRLDIFSDPVCPWCYVGKTNLERALEARPDHPFRIEWHPFQLNPDMAPEGVDRRAYLEAKFGGAEQVAAIHVRLAQVAREAGLSIDFDAVPRIPNTMDAHRLIHWAGLEGRQTAMVGRLFRAYWREGKDIGDKATLAALGGDVGMDPAVVTRLLASDADAGDLAARDLDARRKGVTGVPLFLIAQQYAVSGAQPAETWLQIIDELATKAQPQG